MGLAKGSNAMNHGWHDTRSCPVRANCSFMEGHVTCVAWCNLALGANITLLFSSLNNQGIVNSCVVTFFIMKKREHWRIIAENNSPKMSILNFKIMNSFAWWREGCRAMWQKLYIRPPGGTGRTETGSWTLWQNWQQLFTIWSLFVYCE